MSRNADYSLTKIAEKFQPTAHDRIIGTCGNIQWQVNGEPYTGKGAALKPNPKYKALYERVSAPMMLARLCALFSGLQIHTGGQDDYKTTWEIVLEHKESGAVVTFYDYKGGPSFGSDVYGDKASKEFIKDVKALIDVLCNDRCPHPYDGCVVGEVA